MAEYLAKTDILNKPTWIPFYIQRMKASSAWKLPDYQFCWYWKLLTELADSVIPGYLPGSLDELWRLAGARSRENFVKFGGPALISRYFKRVGADHTVMSAEGRASHGGQEPRLTTGVGQDWIYNEKMLEVLHEQGKKLTKRRRRCISSILSSPLEIQNLPEEIPMEEFKDYMEMREEIKKPLTARGLKIAVSKLLALKEQGHDLKLVLQESVFNRWAGVFELKRANGNGNGYADVGRSDAPTQADIEYYQNKMKNRPNT